MMLFIWEDVRQVTARYHSGGGIAVIAESEDAARELANQQRGCEIELDERPEYSCAVIADAPRVFLFPDAGCC